LSGQERRQVAFAATKAVGNSPDRHRHVRKLREFYRLNKPVFPEQSHLFLIVRRPVEDWTAFELRLRNLLTSLATNPRLDSHPAD